MTRMLRVPHITDVSWHRSKHPGPSRPTPTPAPEGSVELLVSAEPGHARGAESIGDERLQAGGEVPRGGHVRLRERELRLGVAGERGQGGRANVAPPVVGGSLAQ